VIADSSVWIDCLIAASCIELDQPLLHRDSDFDRIARIESSLRIELE
jgi:predicted nucleic acid-binding protein